MSQLQPKWPLKMDPHYGPYASIDDVAKSIHQDFLQLLKTIPGEWPGRPDLGIGLAQHLFESANSHEFGEIKSRIKSQVSKYLRAVKVTKVEINASPDLIDRNQVKITIEYYIKPLGIKRTLGLAVQDDKIHEEEEHLTNNTQSKSPHRLPSAYGAT